MRSAGPLDSLPQNEHNAVTTAPQDNGSAEQSQPPDSFARPTSVRVLPDTAAGVALLDLLELLNEERVDDAFSESAA